MRFAMLFAAVGTATISMPAQAAITIRAQVNGTEYTYPGCPQNAPTPECMRPPVATPLSYSLFIELPDGDLQNGQFSLGRHSGPYGSYNIDGLLTFAPGATVATGTNLTFQGYSRFSSTHYFGSVASFTAIRDARVLPYFSVTFEAVPEPATWAMMMVGFGAMGASLRSRRTQARVAFA